MQLIYKLFSCWLLFCSFKPPKQLPKYGVQQCYFFSKAEFTGTVMIDDDGKKKSKNSWYNHFIYIETKGNSSPQWKSLYYKNKYYKITTNFVKDSLIVIGKNIDNNKDVIVRSQKGNKLWLLNIDSLQSNITNTPFFLILNGEKNKSKIQLKILQKVIELEPEMRP